MNNDHAITRLALAMLAALVLQGCAAAAMVRDRPDFEDERQRLAPVTYDAVPAESWQVSSRPVH